MAAVSRAKAAVAATRSPLVGFRDERARGREWVITELLGTLLENAGRGVDEQRRQRELALTRRLEDVAALDLASLQIAGFAGHPEIVFGAIVVGFEIGVAERPIGER